MREVEIGTAVDTAGNSNLNFRGPQSTRPLSRWYWFDGTQNRWRRFDNAGTGMERNATLEKLSEKTKGGLKPGTVIKIPGGNNVTVLTWDHPNRRGTYKWRGSPHPFQRLSQREAAEIQANNFVYDHSGASGAALSRTLADNAHVVQHFREMLDRELEGAKTHVFMYHSYHNVSLLYDLGACLMRIAFPEKVTKANRASVLPRTDRSTFNTRSPVAIQANFGKWYNGTDVAASNPPTQKFPWVGVSMVLNCFKTNPESTVVRDFQKGYNPGDSPPLNPLLDDILERFGISGLRAQLLQLTIEADVDVTSFLGNKANFFERENAGQAWKPMAMPMGIELMARFLYFMEHDSELGHVTESVQGWDVTLHRDGPGMQAYGTAKGPNGATREVLTVTVNPGQYLQLAVPLELVDQLAYAALPFGTSDTGPTHALSKMDQRTDLTDGGQARLIPRPDLMWDPRVKQRVYQFSRGAESKRAGYLKAVETLLRNTLGSEGLLRTRRLLAPPPVVVRSHNVWYKNKEMDALVEFLSSAATYDFACLQEGTDVMLDALAGSLPASHRLLYDRACGSANVFAAMAYRSERFTLRGAPFFGCFKLKTCKKQGGRPVVGGVFFDELLWRHMVVVSVHAPHDCSESYRLLPNLEYFVKQTLAASDVDEEWTDVSHVVFAGDFNRGDWSKSRALAAPRALKLHSAQGGVGGTFETNSGKPIDNVLYGSTAFRYMLELVAFERHSRRGSDHNAVEAVFAA